MNAAAVGARAHLRALFADKPDGTYILIWSLATKRSTWSTSPEAAARVAEMHARTSDVYVGMALSPDDFGSDARCPVEKVAGLVALWAEVDVADPVHAKANLPPDKAAARSLLDEAVELEPSIVVDSGHGLQAVWLLDEPWIFETDDDRRAGQELMHRLHATVAARAKQRGWALDNVSDLARILRVVGTTNRKDPDRPATVAAVEFDPSRRYAPSDFDGLLLDATVSAQAEAANCVGDSPTGHLDDDELLERARSHWNGEDIQKLWDGDSGAHGGDVSAADLALCCHLAFLTGKDASRIDRLFRRSSRLRGKWDEKHAADGRTYGEMTIDKAIEFTGDVYRPLSAQLARQSAQHVNGKATAPVESVQTTAVLPVRVDEKLDQVEREFLLECFNEEEFGDARLFGHLYRGRLVYDHGEKAWYRWNGHAWRKDKAGMVKRLVAAQVAAQYLHLAAEIVKQAEGASDDDQIARSRKLADRLMERARNLRKLARAQNVISFASSLLGITGEEWDGRPTLLGAANGVVDLTTGEMRPGNPTDYLRTSVPTDWRGLHAPCARWERFLAEILEPVDDPDEPAKALTAEHRAEQTQQIVRFLQRLLGYGISGHSTEHVLPIFWGVGRNGKDTLLETLGAVLGPAAGPASTDVLLARERGGGGAQPYLYDLWGRRLVWASETNEGARLNASQVKLVTGGGRIKTRPLYGNLVEFEPTHLLILMTNAKPHAPADDYALWKRILLIAFQQRYVANPDPAKGERQRDAGLRDQLAAEASGILAWLVRGYLSWQRQGLDPPAPVQIATEQYREEEDTLALFLAERTDVSPNDRVSGKALYEDYRIWVTGEKPMGPTAFGKKMAAKLTKKRETEGVYYLGVRLLPSSSTVTVGSRRAAETPAETPAPASDDGLNVGSRTPSQSQSVGSVGKERDFAYVGQSRMEKNANSLQSLQTLHSPDEREVGEL